MFFFLLFEWFVNRKLMLSSEKSSSKMFTTWLKESWPTLNIGIDNVRTDNDNVRIVKNSWILGVLFDPMLMFVLTHAKHISRKIKKRKNALNHKITWGEKTNRQSQKSRNGVAVYKPDSCCLWVEILNPKVTSGEQTKMYRWNITPHLHVQNSISSEEYSMGPNTLTQSPEDTRHSLATPI